MDLKYLLPLLNDVMDATGYQWVQDGTFRARWASAEVEHYLYWRTSRDKGYLTGEFGIRNPVSEKYAQTCATLYGGLSRRDLQREYENYSCYTRYTLARVTSDAKQIVIIFTMMCETEFRSQILDIVEHKAIPAISTIASTSDLYHALDQDGGLCPWYATNTAVRAAKLAKLGSMVGIPQQDTEETLVQHQTDIQQCIGSDRSARVYIHKVLQHVDDACPSQA